MYWNLAEKKIRVSTKMPLSSDFDYIQPLLQKVAENNTLTELDKAILSGFLDSSVYQVLPVTASEATESQQEPLYFLKKAADMLASFIEGDLERALATAQETNKLHFVSDAFEGWFFRCAINLAQKGDFPNAPNLQNLFLERYKNYRNTYTTALENTFEVLSTSLEVFEDLQQPPPIPATYRESGSYTFVSRGNSETSEELVIIVILSDNLTDLKKFKIRKDAVNLLEPDESSSNFNIILDLLTLSKEAKELISSKQGGIWTIRLVASIDNESTVIESSQNLVRPSGEGILLFLTVEDHILDKHDLNMWFNRIGVREIVLIKHS